VDLASTLTSSLVMVVTVTGSTTQTGPLSAEDLARALEGCEEAEFLAGCKTRILDFIESRMTLLAPNISAILGTTIAAKLLGTAGGLNALAAMPSCNIQVSSGPPWRVRRAGKAGPRALTPEVCLVAGLPMVGCLSVCPYPPPNPTPHLLTPFRSLGARRSWL
jgi:hypothetical protein